MGGGEGTTIQAPAAPQAPTTRESLQDFIKSLPDLLSAQQEFAPQFAQLQQDIQRQLSPITAGLQETLAGQAQAGLGAELPEEIRESFLSQRRAQLGTNVRAPIGAEDISRNLLLQQRQFQRESQNLALSLAGRQQLPGISGAAALQQGIPSQALPFAAQRFSTQAGIFGSQAGLAGQQASLNLQRRGQNLSFAGDIIGGGLSGVGAAGGFGQFFG